MMRILRMTFHAIIMFLLAAIAGYFIWQAVFIILLTTPFKGMSLNAAITVYLVILVVSLVLLLVLYHGRRIRGILYLCGSVGIVFVLALFISKIALSARKEALIKELAAMGCVIPVSPPAPVPLEENAAPRYEKVLQMLKDGSFPACFNKFQHNLGNVDFTPVEVETLRRWLDLNSDALAGLAGIEKYRRFRYQEYGDQKDKFYNLTFMNLSKIRKLAKLLCAEIIVGRAGKAVAPQQLVHIVGSLHQERNLIYQVVSRYIATDILSLCAYELLHSGRSTVPASSIDDMAAIDFLIPGLQDEINGIVRFGTRRVGPAALRLVTGAILDAWVCENLYLVKEELAIVQDPRGYQTQHADSVFLYSRRLPAMPYSIFPVMEFSLLVKKEIEYRAVGDLVRIIGALVQYRRKNGEYPATLADLDQGGFMDPIPSDAFGGKQYSYYRSKNEIKVYSIGPDGKDDGGMLDKRADIGYDFRF